MRTPVDHGDGGEHRFVALRAKPGESDAIDVASSPVLPSLDEILPVLWMPYHSSVLYYYSYLRY